MSQQHWWFDDCETRLRWYFRCCICQRKPSSKDKQWEMSEEKEKSDKGTSLGLLLEICQINHTEKVYSSFLCLVICLFVCLETISRPLKMCENTGCSSREKDQKKMRQSHTGSLFPWSHKHKSGEIYILQHLSVNNNIIFSSNFTLSPFSVGGCFSPAAWQNSWWDSWWVIDKKI